MVTFSELWNNGGIIRLNYLLSVRNLFCMFNLDTGSKIISYYTLLFYGPYSILVSLVDYEPLNMRGAGVVVVMTKVFAKVNIIWAGIVMVMSVVFLILGFGENKRFFIMELYCIIYAVHNLTHFFYNEMLTIAVFFAICTSSIGVLDFYFDFVTVKYLAFVMVNFNYFLVNAYFNVVVFSYRKRLTVPYEDIITRI